MQMISRDFRICRTDIEIALHRHVVDRGEPAFAQLLAPARIVERDDQVGASVSKSAGGSLNARWPFSPMPTNATSIGALASSRPDAVGDRVGVVLDVEQVVRG